MKINLSGVVRVVASFLVLTVAAPVPGSASPTEARMGDSVYKYLVGQRIIVDPHSPLYDVLNPIAMPLKAVADPRYDMPFLFTIGRDPYPNVASVPGGRVYVSDKAFQGIRYREELAGALCHAVAHTVRHDSAKAVNNGINASLTGAALILLLLHRDNGLGMTINQSEIEGAGRAGQAVAGVGMIAAAAKVESDADLMGADLCAQAGLNPWGLVWLLQNYQKIKMGGRMEMLADFPADRVRNLEAHFASQPDVFGKFDRERTHGTLLKP